MAQHLWREITWEGRVPSKTFLKRFNRMLRKEDYDAPLLDADGMNARWRSPLIDLVVLLNTLHLCGHPCRGRETQECHHGCDCCGARPEVLWQKSKADLSMLKDTHLRKTLRELSPKLAKKLPPEEG